jgi:SAM domain (Sterile alpha motif)
MTTIDVPPSYPTFGSMHAKPVTSTPIPSNNVSTTSVTTTVPQMPQWFFPFLFSGVNTCPPFEKSVSNLSELSSKCPTIGEFLSELDNIHNGNGIYKSLENAFIEEDITVNAIKDLTDEELISIGVNKIGWRKNIKQASNKY